PYPPLFRSMELTDGKGADVCFDPVGGDRFDAALSSLGWGGRMLLIGFVGGVPHIPANRLLVKHRAALGSSLRYFRWHAPDKLRRSVEELLERYAKGTLKPLVTHRLPLERGGQRQSRAAREAGVREADRCGSERGLRRWRPRTPALDRRPGGGAARAPRPARGPLVDLSVRRRDREAGPADRLRPRHGAAADGPADRRRGGGADRARQSRGGGGRAHPVGAGDGGDHRRQQPDRRAGGQA